MRPVVHYGVSPTNIKTPLSQLMSLRASFTVSHWGSGAEKILSKAKEHLSTPRLFEKATFSKCYRTTWVKMKPLYNDSSVRVVSIISGKSSPRGQEHHFAPLAWEPQAALAPAPARCAPPRLLRARCVGGRASSLPGFERAEVRSLLFWAGWGDK